MLKVDEERTSTSPAIADYKKLVIVHRLVKVLMIVSLTVFAVHVFSWITMPVRIATHE
jgi:hypothetical protein